MMNESTAGGNNSTNRIGNSHRFLQRAGIGEQGQVAVLFGLMLTVLLGMVAMGVDGGNLYLIRRQMQSAADLAVKYW